MRPIIVRGQPFRWRFNQGTAERGLVVVPTERSSPQLTVESGWVDHLEPDGPGNEPQIVTPRFVAAAIEFALDQNWDPTERASSVQLSYDGMTFQMPNTKS